MSALPLLALLLLAQAPPRALTLDQALHLASENQPSLRQARASVEVARAREGEALAPNLPQVNAQLAYSRSTANFASRPGSIPSGLNLGSSTSWDTFDYWSGSITASQTIWDFQQTWGRYRAAQSAAEAQADTERATTLTVQLSVRTAYFAARAQMELVDVAEANLKAQQDHLAQIAGFVKVGTRPEIDLAQARANLANARVQKVNAANGCATAKARLRQAMGVVEQTDYDVVDAELPEVQDEGGALVALVDEAVRARPEAAAYEAELRAQRYTVRAVRGAYLPSLGANLGFTLAGGQLAHLQPNATGQLTLSWQAYGGGITRAQVQEAESQLEVIAAQRDAFVLQIRLDVEQAQLAVRAAREALAAADEALDAATAQASLAEGRYRAGVGSGLELTDAQAAVTTAAAQRVGAAYQLATARAQLLSALGR